MASTGDQGSSSHQDDLEPEFTKGYKPPEQKTMEEILKADAEDESLNKYKSTLLQGAAKVQPPFPDDKRNVVVGKLSILVEGRPDMTLDLIGDVSTLKSKPLVIKEGCQYKVKIDYYVQREIVSGLKYIMASYRGPVKVDKDDVMLGSYAPRQEAYTWTSEVEEAPKGMLARGTYLVKSRFTDDDKADHLTWEWCIKIASDWSASAADDS